MHRTGWIAGVRRRGLAYCHFYVATVRRGEHCVCAACSAAVDCMCPTAPQVVSKRTPTVSGTRAVRGPRIGRPRASRARIIVLITELLEKHQASVLRLADLCEVTGVSERTLRTMFREQFGVGPKRYLRTRKLHAVRAALAVADPARETVSGIARRFGLSDFGRMAKDYSALFGEYPRATLMRKPRGAGKACYAKLVG